MNHREAAQAKDCVRFGHDIAYLAKLIDYHLVAFNDSCKITRERKLREIRQLLSEVLQISNNLYHAGFDALKDGDL